MQGPSVSERASGGCALLSPLQLKWHLLGALARAALPAEPWGRTRTGWSPRRGGVAAVARMLWGEGAEDGEGSFAMSCPSVSGRLAADMVTDTYTCFAVAALLSIFRRGRGAVLRHFSIVTPFGFVALSSCCLALQTSRCPSAVQHFAFSKPLLQPTPITCFRILRASCQQPISLPHKISPFLFPTHLQFVIYLLVGQGT